MPTLAFARMVQNSRTLTDRTREIADLREQALGDAIAAETGKDVLRQRVVAAQLASVHRVLYVDGFWRVLAGEPREEICKLLVAAADEAFDRLEPFLGDLYIKA